MIRTVDDAILAAVGGIIAEAGAGFYDEIQKITDLVMDGGEMQGMAPGVATNVYIADGGRKFHITVVEEIA